MLLNDVNNLPLGFPTRRKHALGTAERVVDVQNVDRMRLETAEIVQHSFFIAEVTGVENAAEVTVEQEHYRPGTVSSISEGHRHGDVTG